ncbi:hypothetical protein EJB05_16299, partial [Eragrostis curvula]
MAGRRPRRPRRQKRRSQAASTHISSLPDDILMQIFLLLPSLATLVRAACTCCAWRRAVVSFPDFRRRFRALHPTPPLLGLFFDTFSGGQNPSVPTFSPVWQPPSAAATSSSPPSTSAPTDTTLLTAAVATSSFGDSEEEEFDEVFVVLNPLKRQEGRVSCIFHENVFLTHDAYAHPNSPDVYQARLVFSEVDPSSFHIVLLAHGEDEDDHPRVCVSVFSSKTGEWSFLPWVNVPEGSKDDDYNCTTIVYEGRMQANGFLYWLPDDRRRLITLDTATMEFSFAKLPVCLSEKCTYDAGETKEGDTCIVYSDGSNIGVLMLRRDEDGAERWMLDRVISMTAELKRVMQDDVDKNAHTKVFVFAVRDGYAYLSTTPMFNNPRTPCWFLSLCLETMRLEKLFQRTYDSDPLPYIMSWPLCLGRFALEGLP